MVLQSEPSNIHVLPFTPLMVSVQKLKKRQFWMYYTGFSSTHKAELPPIFPISINDKRSLWTKAPERYYMAQRVGPFSSFFLKQNASLISDEVEVVQQARGVFFGL